MVPTARTLAYEAGTESRLPLERVAELSRSLGEELAKQIESERPPAAREASLLAWAARYLPHHFTRPPSAMHLWLDEQFGRMNQERGLKLNCVGPRGAAKSTVATLAWVLRLALDDREPYIWIVSDTRDQAHAHLANIRDELLENERLLADYGSMRRPGRAWRRRRLDLANGVVIEALGTLEGMRGRRSGAHRPTTILCDDLENDGHMRSARARERSSDWFHGALLRAGTKRTNIVNLATALHREALAMRLCQAAGWNSHIFRAISIWPENMDLWREWEAIYTDREQYDPRARARRFYDEHAAELNAGVELLWPEEDDLYSLMCMRVESGHTAFEREKQASPIDPLRCEFPDHYFDDDMWFDEWPKDHLLRTMALDPSKGRDARYGDYSAFVMLALDANGVFYLDADLARRATPRIVADGVELAERFRPDAFGVESNMYQELLAGEFAAEFARRRLVTFHPWTLDNRVNKQVRIRRLGPLLAGRRLRFKRRSYGAELLVRQLRDFPMADHDDGPDAAEMAVRLALELMEGANRKAEE